VETNKITTDGNLLFLKMAMNDENESKNFSLITSWIKEIINIKIRFLDIRFLNKGYGKSTTFGISAVQWNCITE
jgi:hypothetical protein